MMDLGERVFKLISKMDKTIDRNDPHFRARSIGRLMEEMTELCIAGGLHPSAALCHVVDALHNEAKKVGYYPSQLEPGGDRSEVVTELGDCRLLMDYLCYIHGVSRDEVTLAATEKAEKMERWAETGQAHIVDGLYYRKSSRP